MFTSLAYVGLEFVSSHQNSAPAKSYLLTRVQVYRLHDRNDPHGLNIMLFASSLAFETTIVIVEKIFGVAFDNRSSAISSFSYASLLLRAAVDVISILVIFCKFRTLLLLGWSSHASCRLRYRNFRSLLVSFSGDTRLILAFATRTLTSSWFLHNHCVDTGLSHLHD